MCDHQIRRLPMEADQHLVESVALGDFAVDGSDPLCEIRRDGWMLGFDPVAPRFFCPVECLISSRDERTQIFTGLTTTHSYAQAHSQGSQ